MPERPSLSSHSQSTYFRCSSSGTHLPTCSRHPGYPVFWPEEENRTPGPAPHLGSSAPSLLVARPICSAVRHSTPTKGGGGGFRSLSRRNWVVTCRGASERGPGLYHCASPWSLQGWVSFPGFLLPGFFLGFFFGGLFFFAWFSPLPLRYLCLLWQIKILEGKLSNVAWPDQGRLGCPITMTVR